MVRDDVRKDEVHMIQKSKGSTTPKTGSVIVAKTFLEKIPENCWACGYCGCNLPCQARNKDLLQKAYKTKRHKDCPLMEMNLDGQKGGD